MRLKKGGVNRAPDDQLGCEYDDMRQDCNGAIESTAPVEEWYPYEVCPAFSSDEQTPKRFFEDSRIG